ncbi:predicted protein [Chaetomium globosum CBS 148.51]|uniref:Uncharacterized protein n=1 Tax=Chaetomium globosum (strain ATCC 6205 / CBS 148.51 / DSM 1962 / NBRC 6347 / NRRL 1970) TaxID=306901 RepID=Q2H0J8_CHAGB|nr:uncharacterized protein CHGG_04698 [Chaetomium globosum CBS 148.51]EAQ88079.1 predicted protein [Chaetomium globosum CBS 148.51]
MDIDPGRAWECRPDVRGPCIGLAAYGLARFLVAWVRCQPRSSNQGWKPAALAPKITVRADDTAPSEKERTQMASWLRGRRLFQHGSHVFSTCGLARHRGHVSVKHKVPPEWRPGGAERWQGIQLSTPANPPATSTHARYQRPLWNGSRAAAHQMNRQPQPPRADQTLEAVRVLPNPCQTNCATQLASHCHMQKLLPPWTGTRSGVLALEKLTLP